MASRLPALDSGAIVSTPSDRFGYYGWPSACALPDGRVLVVASGMRQSHVCPFGRTVLCIGSARAPAGRGGHRIWSWTPPRVIGDTPLDDRDAGVVRLGDGTLVVSWFTMHHGERLREAVGSSGNPTNALPARAALDTYAPDVIDRWYGSWLRTSDDVGDTWGTARRAPVTAPHGPIVQPGAERGLLYFGKEFRRDIDGDEEGSGPIAAFRTSDAGESWTRLGEVPFAADSEPAENQEPHLCVLGGGAMLGLIRLSATSEERLGVGGFVDYCMAETYSLDGGHTWSQPDPFAEHGSTPHLLLHSSGTVIATYGYREDPYGLRVRLAADTSADGSGVPLRWSRPYVLRDDGVDADAGYPATVELADGSLLTVSYGRHAPGDRNCGLLWVGWQLP